MIFWKLQAKYYKKELLLAAAIFIFLLIFAGIIFAFKHSEKMRLALEEKEKDLQTALCLLNKSCFVNEAAMWRAENNVKLLGE